MPANGQRQGLLCRTVGPGAERSRTQTTLARNISLGDGRHPFQKQTDRYSAENMPTLAVSDLLSLDQWEQGIARMQPENAISASATMRYRVPADPRVRYSIRQATSCGDRMHRGRSMADVLIG